MRKILLQINPIINSACTTMLLLSMSSCLVLYNAFIIKYVATVNEHFASLGLYLFTAHIAHIHSPSWYPNNERILVFRREMDVHPMVKGIHS